MKGIAFLQLTYNGWSEHKLNVSRPDCESNTMDQVEKLLELYRRTKTPSERQVLLETVRISSPQEFARLEERILKDHVRVMTLEQLIQAIADHRGLTLQQAEELLRDTVFQHLLDRARLAALLLPPSESPSAVTPAQSEPQTSKQNESGRRGVEVVLLKDSQNDTLHSDASSSAATPLPRLAPRGIGG